MLYDRKYRSTSTVPYTSRKRAHSPGARSIHREAVANRLRVMQVQHLDDRCSVLGIVRGRLVSCTTESGAQLQ